MIHRFAKEYKESITLVYFCGNLLLTIVVFVVGTIYIWHRDRRDQERRLQEGQEYQNRRDQEDRRDQERRLQEGREYQNRRDQEDRRDHRRREWRQFAERIYTDYSKLKSKDIPQKIAKVKNTFERILIHSTVTGLDVLRYMLTDDNYRNFASNSPQLKALREDLHMIFVPLNICSSLLLLGEVPINIKEELRLVVEELGNLAEPFLTGEQQRVALKCLKYFGSNRSSNAVTEHAQRSVKELDERIKAIAPYVNSLQFGGPNSKEFRNDFPQMGIDMKDYSECRKFWLNKTMIMQNRHENLKFLIQLHEDLECKELEAHCARIFREELEELPAESFEQISDSDSDEAILMKFLHELRLYIHIILSENQFTMVKRLVEGNVDRLRKLRERLQPIKVQIKELCQRFSDDLMRIKRAIEGNPPRHLTGEKFFKQLSDLYDEKFLRIITGEEV